MIATTVTVTCFFLLPESNPVIILTKRKQQMEKKNPKVKYRVDGASDRPQFGKSPRSQPLFSCSKRAMLTIAQNSKRAARILLTQPTVLAMSLYQALIFSSMYSLYTNFEDIWSNPLYNFTQLQVGLTYLGPAIGLILTAALLITWIDKIYNHLAEKSKDGQGVPEYRLPLANIGAVLLPISLFWFGWTIEYGRAWPIPLSGKVLFGAAQVSIFNTSRITILILSRITLPRRWRQALFFGQSSVVSLHCSFPRFLTRLATDGE